MRSKIFLLVYLLPLFTIVSVSAQNIPLSYNIGELLDLDEKCILDKKKEGNIESIIRLYAVAAYDYRNADAFGQADTIRITYTYETYTLDRIPYKQKWEYWIADAEFVLEDDGHYLIRESHRKYEDIYKNKMPLSFTFLDANAEVIGHSDNQLLYAVQALELWRKQFSGTRKQYKHVTPNDIIGSWGHHWNQGGGIGQFALFPLFKGEKGEVGVSVGSSNWLERAYVFASYCQPSPKYWESVEIGTEPGLNSDDVWSWQWADIIFHSDGTFNYIESVWYPEYWEDFSRGSTITYVGRWEISDSFIIIYISTPEECAAPDEHIVVELEPTDKIVVEYNDYSELRESIVGDVETFMLISRGYEKIK